MTMGPAYNGDESQMEVEQEPSSASLCCRLQRRLLGRDTVKAAVASFAADLDALEPELSAVAQQERILRLRLPKSPFVRSPGWTPTQKSALAALLVRLHSQPTIFADILVAIGVDDELADAFANDLMPDCDPVPVIAAVRRLDRGASRCIVRAVVRRFPVKHLADIVDDVIRTNLDLFDESNTDTVAFVGSLCDRILSLTTTDAVPANVALVAAAHDTLEVIFVDWIATAMKHSPAVLARRSIAPRDTVNLIVVADNLAAVATGAGHQSKMVIALREQWRTTLSTFARQLQYAAPAEVAPAHRCDAAVWTVRAGDIVRIAQRADPILKSLVVADPGAYVVLRTAMTTSDVQSEGVGAELVAFLQRRPPLVECPRASLRQQLSTGSAAGIVRRLFAVLHDTVPGGLMQDDFRPLLIHLLQHHDQDDSATLAALSLQVQAAREQLRKRKAAVADAEASACARAAIDAIKQQTQKFVDGLSGVDAKIVCREVADDGAFICKSCRDFVRARSRLHNAFTDSVVCHVGSEAISHRVRQYIGHVAARAVAPACRALGRVLDRLAASYATVGAFRAAFGGPVCMDPYDEADFDEAVACLSRVGDGVGDDWARIVGAHAIISEIVAIGRKTEANVAADVIATLAYAIVKGRADRLGMMLTMLAASDDDISRSRTFIHTSVAVNALFTMFGVTKSKLHSSNQTPIEA